MEETKERVKVRSDASTEVATGSRELGDQITRLMATLTRVEQGSCPASAPNSPRHRGHGRGQADSSTPPHSSSHNGLTGLGQTVSTCRSSAASRESTDSPRRGNTQVQNDAQGGGQSTRDSNLLQCFRCQSWGHIARECATPAKILNQDGGPKGMQSNPLKQQSVSLQHSLSHLEPKLTQAKAVNKKGQREIAPIPFLNPDPVAHLVGHSNEALVVIDG